MDKIKHLLFDIDGVLFFHSEVLFSDLLIKEYGADRRDVEAFFRDVWPECLVGSKDIKVELSARMRQWNWTGDVESLMDYWFTSEHQVDKPLIDYVRELTQRGIPSSVATNNDHYRAAWVFKQLNLDQTVFDKLYAAGDLGVAKPDPEFFRIIMVDLPHLKPANVLFWDDGPDKVQAARSFGMAAELYTTFQNFKEKMKQYV